MFLSWFSSIEILEHHRDRSLVALTGVVLDLDGLGLIFDKIIGRTNYYFQYHHYVSHSIFTAIVISVVATFFTILLDLKASTVINRS